MEDGSVKTVGITRIHLEEDAGKAIHGLEDESYIDFNRCGTPLVEIVSEPDIRSPQEARRYLERLKQTLQYTGVSEADMEKGHLRCDANISVRPRGDSEFGTRTEMKNLNSFRGVERGLAYEIRRQVELLEQGNEVEQCTLTWDEAASETHLLRTKEEAQDYRYFPEPDLVPLEVDPDWVKIIRAELPELPAQIEERFNREYNLKFQDIEILTRERELAAYYEAVVKGGVSPGEAARWVLGEVLRVLKEEHQEIGEFPMKPEALGELIKLSSQGTINRNTAKSVFDKMLAESLSAAEIVERDQLGQVSDSAELEDTVRQVVSGLPAELERYLKGETRLLGFFMGQVMRATKGKGDPQVVRGILQRVLDEV